MSDSSPAARFVLALARGDAITDRDLSAPPASAASVAQLAARHHVDALCGWQLRQRLGIPRPGTHHPEWVRLDERLRSRYLHHLLRNQALEADITEIHRALSQRGVPAVYFKGLWLAHHAYPDPGTRSINDIDLGVHEIDHRAAIEALGRAGYRPVDRTPNRAGDALQRAHYGQQLRFLARARRPVELHFRLINLGPPARDDRWLWATTREMTLDSGDVIRVPGPEAMLLHLLIHANQHAFAVLKLLHDIRWCLHVDQTRIDWDRLTEKIRTLRARSAAYHALQMAHTLAHAPAPDSVLRAWRPTRARRALFRWCWQLPAATRLEHARRPTELEAPLLYLLEMGTPWDKARYLVGLARTSGPTQTRLKAWVRSRLRQR